MRTKILTLIACLAVLLMGNISCKKYLDLKSDARLVVPQTLNDLQGLLDDAALMNFMRSPSFGETSADDYFWPEATINAASNLTRDIYFWRKIDYRYQNDWSEAYLAIYNTNVCLEGLGGVERIPANAKSWDNIKGSALFYRSFYFFALTMQFGKAYDLSTSGQDLGIALRLQSNFNIPSTRSNVQACLERVISDAADAVQYLPELPLSTTRPSKAAAYALLSRVYLYMRDYPNALKFSNESLKLQSSLMDFNSDPDVLGLDITVPFRRFNKETIFYAELFPGMGLHSPSSARIDSTLYSSYSTNDLRKRAYFRVNGGNQVFKGSYASNAFTLFSGLAVDEMFLTRAESRAWTGDIVGAMADLNLLLKTRWRKEVVYVPVVASGREEALGKIRLERRKELLMRNLRWPDIKRLNKEGANIIPTRLYKGQLYRLEVDAPYYALPLPIDIVEQSGIPQN
ncbi:RagB/SusD family nutrient uptake outer membrane protein [Pedobacter aquatilis]|uniref:RagB/SusD family nutrient uptake outer membrane protein n=1 Tax=Pedobacter aquatilis TaxID=351343 RepID=UPI00293089C4|nr:RagB/SusD family nutrient uptake outer membrane protein [Pedobacter aquatilis]